MDIRIKILLTAFPFIIAAYVGFSMLQPAMDDANSKENQVNEKQAENDKLEGQLKGSGKVKEKFNQLTAEIDALRASVPKSPDNDLLAIDLEKMCKDAGMNMVAFLPDKEKDEASKSAADKAAAEDKSAGNLKAKQDRLKNMLKGGGAGSDADAAAAPIKAPSELSTGFKKFIVTGDYAGLQKLVHEMETYQRVLKIDDIAFRLPKAANSKDRVKIDDTTPSEGEEGGDPRLLFITMSLTTYYLP